MIWRSVRTPQLRGWSNGQVLSFIFFAFPLSYVRFWPIAAIVSEA
jgi:hypothetical protein